MTGTGTSQDVMARIVCGALLALAAAVCGFVRIGYGGESVASTVGVTRTTPAPSYGSGPAAPSSPRAHAQPRRPALASIPVPPGARPLHYRNRSCASRHADDTLYSVPMPSFDAARSWYVARLRARGIRWRVHPGEYSGPSESTAKLISWEGALLPRDGSRGGSLEVMGTAPGGDDCAPPAGLVYVFWTRP